MGQLSKTRKVTAICGPPEGTGIPAPCPHAAVLHGAVAAHQPNKQDSFIDTQVFKGTSWKNI